MDLLKALRAAHVVSGLAHDLGSQALVHQPAAWETDERAFFMHFGVSFETYQEVLAHLSAEQARVLEATIEVNPEAAVLWVLAMEVIG
jgi:hypothetical protein